MGESWHKLFAWLNIDSGEIMVERRQVAGTDYYGLYTKKPIPPKTVLFAVPKYALLNSKTLASLYNLKDLGSLSAVQMISLHLLLHQEGGADFFSPYISTLPRDFNYHPLTWMVKRDVGPSVQLLPPSVIRALQNISSKFRSDLSAIRSFVHHHSELLEARSWAPSDFAEDNDLLVSNYLWAWLNVNTRCIYYQVKNSPSDPDNLTLCPILDFANHTSHLPCMNPLSAGRTSVTNVDRGLSVLSPDTSVDAESELYLKYGSHCNRVLFAEYGFVLDPASIPEDQRVLEVKVDDLVQDYISKKGESGLWMKEILETENYWLDWTMHFASGSAFLSYRLITVLRLISIFPSGPLPPQSETMLRPWKEIVLGQREQLSSEHECAWRNLLRQICSAIIERASRALTEAAVRSHESIVVLWEEERFIASQILVLVENGGEL
ncbi:hypothetical protein GYMLUDRAFT_261879 [Collybiopsis luxurians FD-317 M1]|uniref:SET domain-containing protein n=1 Tax=Collybiopsis luxurians FD-317 M1 TaxID=944289 RepID=A0A0D0BWE0_9AGAR|nr:hypothetical protein GYMLUDRAFT_261879 [Collybiopsis luxurians FD-317 M1]